MKKLCIIHIALLSAVCLAAPTANEDFVIAEDAKTYTNAVQAAKTYTDQATNGLLRTEEVPAWAKSPTPPQTITTNDVCNIVTNEVDGWEFTGLPSGAIVEPGYPSWAVGIGWQLLFTHGGVLYFGTTKSYPENATAVTINCIPQSGQQMYSVSMVLRRGNSLGLASVALLSSASTASSNYTDTAIANLPPALSTNDVFNIVTNEVPAEFSKWTLCTNGVPFVTGIVFEFVEMLSEWELHDVNFGDGQICRFETFTLKASIDALTLEMIGYVGGSDQDDDEMWYGNVVAVRTFTPSRNAIGLARLVDLPGLTNGLVLTESDPTVHSWAKSATKPAYTSDEVGAYAAGAGTNLAGVVNLWETYWDGDEVRVTVTNYDSSVHLPSLYLEQKLENTNAYRVVWSESTRWASNALEMAELRSAVDEKADRAWGFYDSHTGEYAPDGFTWLSSPKIAIAGGLAYQRTLTTDGAVWVLVSNGMVAETGGEVTNGFFRIKDDEGNTTFEIVRGNKRTVGATAAGIRVTRSGGSNVVTVPYNVVSEEHPTVYGTTNLSSGEWTELAATWLGQSGAWTAQVSSASATLFIKGEYETGGETYIRNAAPISVEGGLYATNTASGGFVKIRPKYNGSTITWERVQ